MTWLHWALEHRADLWPGMAVAVLLSSVPLFMVVAKNFLPNDDQGEFEVGIRAPEGTSLQATELMANRVATAVRQAAVPDVDVLDGDRGGRLGQDAERGDDLLPDGAHRRADARRVRRRWTGPRHDRPGLRVGAGCAPRSGRSPP